MNGGVNGGPWVRRDPLVGDRTAASERAADPAGWALPAPVRDALRQVIDARRDVRRYRPDPVPPQLLTQVLTAGHRGPSVGHSQPWRFVVVTAPQLREQAAAMADRERLRQAAALAPEAGRRLLDLQLEGIREAPVGIVVCCDRRAPAAGVLGRATFPDTDLWSCACAIQNMWLTARAAGLGLGWVTLFEPAELAALLDLPPGVATLGWLCLGWPDERPPEPGLVRAGWSRRLPLDQVVMRERWAASPPPESHLAAPERADVVGTRDRADRLLTTPGSLGVLDRAVDQVLALRHPRPRSGALLLVAADHPVVGLGVSAYPAAVTRDVVEAAAAGAALGVRLAERAGLRVSVVDAGLAGPAVPGVPRLAPAGPRGNLRDAPALAGPDAAALLEAGRGLGARLARRHGLVALGEVGIGNTTVAAALLCRLLGVPAADLVGLGAGADTATLDRKRAVVAGALRRVDAAHGPGRLDPRTLLAELGGPEVAVLAGAVLGAAAGRAAVVLDGLVVTAAAALAAELAPAVVSRLVAGQRSRERGHAAALRHLGREPLLDLRIRAGEGAGAVLATGLLRAALHARAATATVDR